ncbi:MAG: DUF3016 domain-containing protein [Burkholderiaceae bacterium]
MNTIRSILIARVIVAAVLMANACAAAAADVSITFIDPEKYTDAGYSRSFPDEQERAQVQHDIEQHLRSLAERYLAPGDSLKIDVLDIDLAGHFEPFRFRGGADVRIVRDISWPRIKLRYTLSHDGRVVASATEQLSDMNYLASINRYPSTDRLRYEKPMLDDWFEKRIGKRR